MSLQVWLPLNGTLENKGLSPAKFNLVTTGGGVQSASNGKTSPNCYARTTKNTISHITSDINFTLDGDITMACWCKLTDFGTNNSANGIITQHGHNTGGLGITMKYVSATDYRMSINTGTKGDSFPSAERDRTYITYYGGTNIYNAWHHLCVTYSATSRQVKMYVDGTLETIQGYGTSVTLNGNNTTPRPFRLFDWSTDHSTNASYRPPCSLNDVRLYDHCLSPEEIKLLAQGLVTHYKLDGNNNNNLLPVNSYSFFGATGHGTTNTSTTFPYRTYNNTDSSGYKELCSWSSVITVNANEIYTASFIARSSKNSKMTVYFWNNNSGVQVQNITSSQGHDKGGSDGNCELTLTSEWQRYWITWKFNGTTTALSKNLLFRLWHGNQADIALVKLEKGDKTTPYGFNPSEVDTLIINDCSGCNNHGTCSSTLNINSNTSRYGNSTIFENNKYINCTRASDTSEGTIAAWIKLNSYPGSNTVVIADQNSKISFGFWGTQNAIMSCGGEANSTRTITNLKIKWTINDWHHIVVIKKDNIYTFYLDGVEWSNLGGSYGSNNYWVHTPTNELLIGGRHNGSTFQYPFTGQISDFRLYATALSAAAVKELYQSSQMIDRTGCEYIKDLNEIYLDRSQIKQSGVQNINYASEIIELDDNSCWIQLSHHNCKGGSNLFSSSDDFANKFVYHNDECWSAFHLINVYGLYNNKYEFMVIEQITTTDNIKTYRWTQTKNPLTATYEDVQPGSSNVIYNTNYNIPSGNGGMYKINTNTFFCITNSTKGNWFGAFGAWNKHVNGIPTFSGSSTAGILNLYMRIDPKEKRYREFKNGIIMPTTISEI